MTLFSSPDARDLSDVVERFLIEREPYLGHSLTGPSDNEVKARIASVAELGLSEVLDTTDERHMLASAELLAAVFHGVGRHPTTTPLADLVVGAPLAGCPEGQVSILATASEDASGAVAEDPWDGLDIVDSRATGHKTLVRAARFADAFVATARQAGTPCLVLIPRDQASVTTESLGSPDRLARCEYVRFTDAHCTVVAVGGDARQTHHRIEAFGRLAAIAEITGLAEAAVEQSVDYAKLREQFGRPIGSFQAVKHILAEARFEVHALQATLVRLVRSFEAAPSVDAVAGDAARAYLFAMFSTQRVFDAALQVHGGVGFTLECPLSWYYLRSDSVRTEWGEGRATALRVGTEAAASRAQMASA